MDRPLSLILFELDEAYSVAHAVNLRFARLVERGDVTGAAALGKQIRSTHGTTLRLLREATDAVRQLESRLPEVEERAVQLGMIRGQSIRVDDDLSFARDAFRVLVIVAIIGGLAFALNLFRLAFQGS